MNNIRKVNSNMDILLNYLEKYIPPPTQNHQPTKESVPINPTLEATNKEQFNYDIWRMQEKWMAQHLNIENKWKEKLENS